jgi:hypothetical protein
MWRFELRDDQWERIKNLLLGPHGSVGVTRRIIGCSWRRSCTVIVSECHGAICRSGSAREARSTCGSVRWTKSGVLERVFQHLATDADNEYPMIESTIARATSVARAPKKSRREPGEWLLAWRTEHRDPRHG